ncbi:unnamed protein product [Schistosoma margrebowiei]|uniref:Uncharacterized protein n=1 Tax=Schistosoma margrebowiei TaxID=48269 RepID=A0A183M851_9TREM|nr:unnamed protein product [Schistosoma margrebowiei]
MVTKVRYLVDIGAEVSILPLNPNDWLRESVLNLHAANGKPITMYGKGSDVDKYKLKLAQKKTATLEAASNSVRITIGLITTLLVGYLSDRYGRRAAFGILLVGEVLHVGVTGK